MSASPVEEKRKISFHFHPYDWKNKNHVIQKENNEGVKRKYLLGIASGLKTDGEGERITKRCVEKMQETANSGTLLVFDCPHGVAGTDDIGIITNSQVSPIGEWIIEVRLYDELDGFDKNSPTLQKADKLWKQLNGFPPYVDKDGNPRPLQKGFSIEGYAPPGGIISVSNEGKRVLNDIVLDGVIVTPRPAYTDSVITAVYKTLDELMPQQKATLEASVRDRLLDKIKSGDSGENFYLQYYGAQDALQDILEEYLRHPRQLDDRLNSAFEQYKRIMIELLKRNISMFQNKSAEQISIQKSQRMRTLSLAMMELDLSRKLKRMETVNGRTKQSTKITRRN